MKTRRMQLAGMSLGLLATAALALVAGCDCDPDKTVIGTFETCLTDGCGWEVDQAPGAAIVPTYHPAEHGLAIPPRGVIARDIRLEAAEVQFISSCPRDLELVVTFVPSGRSLSDPTTPTRIIRFIPQATSDPDEGYTWNRMSVFVTAEDEDPGDLVRVVIENHGGSRCIVDQITVLGEPAC